MYYELGGLYQQQQIAFKGLLTVFGAAVALVFGLLLFLYERFRVALAVMAMPLARGGRGVHRPVAHRHRTEHLRDDGHDDDHRHRDRSGDLLRVGTAGAHCATKRCRSSEALIAAGRNRLRPIAMTTIAAILALLPLAFALGQGSAMQQPLAIAIISGLIVQLPLVLLLLPVLLKLLMKKQAI